MTGHPAIPARPQRRVAGLVRAAVRGFEGIPVSLILLLARWSVADVFWTSGRTKVEPGTLLTLSDGAVQLFRDEYGISVPTPGIAAYAVMLSEHVLPALLVLGLASRFAALGLLFMTFVIQIFVYPGAHGVHGPWAVCLLLIMTKGAGTVSLDHLIAARWSDDPPRPPPLPPTRPSAP